MAGSAAALILNAPVMRVLVITGAGISAESGIPTFRGPGGYWRNLDPTKLATPEAFAANPELVWEWYRERRKGIRAAEPNPAHVAIVRLEKRATDFLLVTQNVDDLHVRAGLPKEKMVQIHGDIFVTRCSRCDLALDSDRASALALGFDQEQEQENEQDYELRAMPCCPECGALMRPGVVWFGESLDPQQIERVEEYLARGPVDLALVVGTTALFGYIIDWATRASEKIIEINPDPTPLSPMATQTIRQSAGIALPPMIDSLIASVPRGS